MEEKTQIWVLVQKTSECRGHGDYGTSTKLATESAYSENSFYPAFYSEEEAVKYIKSLKWSYGLTPQRLVIMVGNHAN